MNEKTSIIALFGGTFNPPHLGHTQTLAQLNDVLGFKKVILLPNEIPPHRDKTQVAAEHRLAMLQFAIDELNGVGCQAKQNNANNDVFHLSDYEITQAKQHQQTSYTIHTVQYFSAQCQPNEKLVFVVGRDAYDSFSQWHQWSSILEYASLLVMNRHSDNAVSHSNTETPLQNEKQLHNESQLKPYHHSLSTITNVDEKGIYFAENTPFTVSSTAIRAAIKRFYKHQKGDDVENEIMQSDANMLETSLNSEVLNYIYQHRLYNDG